MRKCHKWAMLVDAFGCEVTDEYVASVMQFTRHSRGFALLSPNYFRPIHDGRIERIRWSQLAKRRAGLRIIAVEMGNARTYAVVNGFKDAREMVRFRVQHNDEPIEDTQRSQWDGIIGHLRHR
jgi:hypothetical protein